MNAAVKIEANKSEMLTEIGRPLPDEMTEQQSAREMIPVVPIFIAFSFVSQRNKWIDLCCSSGWNTAGLPRLESPVPKRMRTSKVARSHAK